jgi:uncharacterized protein
MSQRVRVVLDTNVLVSAVLSSESLPGQTFRLAAGACTLLASEATLAEAEEVFQRPKFNSLVSPAARAEFLVAYREAVQLVPITSRIEICRDARDNKFLSLAIDGQADVIISGDADLLDLNPFGSIRILPPHQFIALAEQSPIVPIDGKPAVWRWSPELSSCRETASAAPQVPQVVSSNPRSSCNTRTPRTPACSYTRSADAHSWGRSGSDDRPPSLPAPPRRAVRPHRHVRHPAGNPGPAPGAAAATCWTD